MSNKRCPRCGKTYPSSYRTCPYCSGQNGRNSRRRRSAPETPLEQIAVLLQENGERIFLACTALFLVIAVFGAVLTQCSSRQDPAPTPDNSAQPPEEENNEPLTEPLAISNPTLALFVDEHAALSVTGGPEDTVNVWTSSDPSVASVEDGIVTLFKIIKTSTSLLFFADLLQIICSEIERFRLVDVNPENVIFDFDFAISSH